ncbi:hypothetical protein VKT23_019186 [Stygiomarasmius scandens]|uniref:C2H2-type domain-containing protein n=1 Tax=Marasmiellus scandens TaxID=2682957 RepID=A0ABR1IP88_9AGAR
MPVSRKSKTTEKLHGPYHSTRRATRLHSTFSSVERMDPSSDEQKIYYRSLKKHIKNQRLVTFCRDSKDWIPWDPPVQVRKSGTLSTVSPNEYEGMPAYVAPICPHSLNEFRMESEYEMRVKCVRKRGQIQYSFCASHPQCIFEMPIPFDPTEHIQNVYNNEGDEIDVYSSAHCSIQSNQSHFTEGRFTVEATNHRASSDEGLIEQLEAAEQCGAYIKHPELHPAFDQSQTHARLEPYSSFEYRRQSLRNLENFDTAIGRAIFRLNSVTGLIPGALRTLINASYRCSACYCEYSAVAFATHLRHDHCLNSPNTAKGWFLPIHDS